MDYRNADGSTSEMCGNGIRVFARYLVEHEGVDPASPMPVGTRAGVLTVSAEPGGDAFTVDMGEPAAARRDQGRRRPGGLAGDPRVDGQPARGGLRRLARPGVTPGALLDPPAHDPVVYPDGVNVEFVVRRGPQHVAMRVHERGSGETRSCGTGACAVMVASALADGGAAEYAVPRGRSWRDAARRPGPADGAGSCMTGPAVLVAVGNGPACVIGWSTR